MRAPPAVSWPVTQDRRWRCVQTLLWAAAAASAGVWIGDGLDDETAATAVLAGSGAALAGAWLGWRTSRQPPGEIHWTGSQWRWSDAFGQDAAVSAPEVMLDLQGWMLLRLRGVDGGRHRWCSVARGGIESAVRWTGFRAAVYSAASRSDRRSGPQRPLS